MSDHATYGATYASSRALVIGINKYKFASPLKCARKDAEAVAALLQTKFGFHESNVTLLVDAHATQENIRREFLHFATDESGLPDDRIMVFFAGHGFTFGAGRRGETGFLVPVDGNVNNLSTLIRWDELTRNADLFTAKHVLFIMDACYGGLALARRPLPAGSMRFLKDMLQRYARQVLTSGKADEVVSDAGGIRAGHSVFTAHLLDGMEGAASTSDGILTANRLMAYVYDKVASDQHSEQTPHYGFIDGDGDFVFDISSLELSADSEQGTDFLIPVSVSSPSGEVSQTTKIDVLKRLIADPREQIRLDDFISSQLRTVIENLGIKNFPVGADSTESFGERLRRYEHLVAELETTIILLSRWATAEQISLLEKIFSRLAETDKGQSGLLRWLHAGWYPIHLLMYASGIAALSAHRYDVLSKVLLTRVRAEHRATGLPDTPLIVRVTDPMVSLSDAFKSLPGHERNHVPRSEYLFTALQPAIEDLLFLGRSYETYFDEFEIMYALIYADVGRTSPEDDVWGPPGRFSWKQTRGHTPTPFNYLVQEARQKGPDWDAYKAGLFKGSSDRFDQVAEDYRKLMGKFRFW